jgi:hypothetical protein
MTNTDQIVESLSKNIERITLKYAVISVIQPLEVKDRVEVLKEIIELYESELEVFGESK